MAEVYLAVQRGLAGFEKPVVIKRILPHLCQDEQFVQMFLDEARLAASLSHSNIVQIFDVQKDAESFFVAMEYISGEDLRFILGKFRSSKDMLPVPIACQIGIDIATGLQAAHESTDPEGKEQGIIHRDIAPSNVIVSFDGNAKLVDFGVAKANVHNIYTRPGALKGKLAYNSPEQIQRKDLDARTDVFSLGIVLWELLTSRRLFKGPSEAAVLRTVMEAPVEPPSSINKNVSKDLDDLVLNALKRNRSARTATAAEITSGLELVLKKAGETTSPHAVSDWMKSAFADRLNRRKTIEQEMAQQAWDVSSPGGDVPSMFSRVENSASVLPVVSASSSVGSVSSDVSMSSAPNQERERNSSKVVLYTIIATLAIIALMGVAFWMGTKSSMGNPDGTGALALASSRSSASTISGAAGTTGTEPSSGSAATTAPCTTPNKKEAAPTPAKVEAPKPTAETKGAAQPRKRFSYRRGPRRPAARPEPQPRVAAAPAVVPPIPVPVPIPVPRAKPTPKPPAPKPVAKPTSSMGTLRVLSDGPGYVFVDGRNTGKTTPTVLKLPVGTHQIMVILKGNNARVRQVVRIMPNKVIHLRLR
jgi:serine/threonine protein kinase